MPPSLLRSQRSWQFLVRIAHTSLHFALKSSHMFIFSLKWSNLDHIGYLPLPSCISQSRENNYRGGTLWLLRDLLRKAAHLAFGVKSGISADWGDLHQYSTCSLAFQRLTLTVTRYRFQPRTHLLEELTGGRKLQMADGCCVLWLQQRRKQVQVIMVSPPSPRRRSCIQLDALLGLNNKVHNNITSFHMQYD